ncbi:MAG: hypothetical protein JXO51_06695, partial [Candidatus Aminicenantes bacterium]|nr:hypothetical protein [Candidatus Aminicenantes bacterium]
RVGDIISFQKGDLRFVHRIVRIGSDEEGWFAVTRGDHADRADPERVRPEHIIGVVVAIVY